MESKYLTLQTIYELVKNNPHPTTSVIQSNEIIMRCDLPWDESAKHLDELRSEHLIKILDHSPALIFITERGIEFILSARSKPGNFMYAA